MKSIALLIFTLVFSMGCASVQNFIEGNERVARITVQASTLKYIDGDADKKRRVQEFVAEQVALLDSGEAGFTIEDLGDRVRAEIDWEDYDDAERLLINELIVAAEEEVENRIQTAELDGDEIVTVRQVLSWMNSATHLSSA